MKKSLCIFLVICSFLCACSSEPETQKPAVDLELVTELEPEDIELHEVDSSCFSAVGYDPNTEVMVVVFRESGWKYAYYGIPENKYRSMCSAPSMGEYYNYDIKPLYPDYERLE